jgi:hypothetical protein
MIFPLVTDGAVTRSNHYSCRVAIMDYQQYHLPAKGSITARVAKPPVAGHMPYSSYRPSIAAHVSQSGTPEIGDNKRVLFPTRPHHEVLRFHIPLSIGADVL